MPQGPRCLPLRQSRFGGGSPAKWAARLSSTMRPIASRTSSVEVPRCGSKRHVVQRAQRLRHGGFELIDIQPRTSDAARLKGRDQRRLVHHIAARDIDQMGMGLHRGQHIRPDQVMGLGPAGRGHHEDIDHGRQVGQAVDLPGRKIDGLGRAVEEQHLHPEAEMTAPRDGLTDPAHADDAHGLARHMQAQHLGRVPALPRARAHQPFAFAGAARAHQDQGHRDIGGGIGHGTGRVGDLDAMGARGLDVDMVVCPRRNWPAACSGGVRTRQRSRPRTCRPATA